MIKSFLDPEGHQNPFSGSKFTAILLKGGFGLLVELQRARVCPAACAAGLFYLFVLLPAFMGVMSKSSYLSLGWSKNQIYN